MVSSYFSLSTANHYLKTNKVPLIIVLLAKALLGLLEDDQVRPVFPVLQKEQFG